MKQNSFEATKYGDKTLKCAWNTSCFVTSFNNDNTAKLGNKRNCRKISFFHWIFVLHAGDDWSCLLLELTGPSNTAPRFTCHSKDQENVSCLRECIFSLSIVMSESLPCPQPTRYYTGAALCPHWPGPACVPVSHLGLIMDRRYRQFLATLFCFMNSNKIIMIIHLVKWSNTNGQNLLFYV